jgi:hypothetical protein
MSDLNLSMVEKLPRLRRWLLLAVLFGAGLLTRGWQVSTPFDHPDEPIAIGMNRWLDHSWDTNWKRASLPDTFDYDQYNFSAYYYVLHGWSKVAGVLTPARWSSERDGIVLLRVFSVLCGALAVGWTFLVGEQLAGTVTGVAGALLVLVNPQLVADGHYARPEALLTWLTLVVVWLALSEERWDWRWRLGLTAFLVGFMIAAKVTMGLMLVAPVWIAWRADGRPVLGGVRFRRLSLALLAVAGFTVAGFVAGVPGALIHPDAFLHGVKILAAQYGGFHEPHSEYGGGRVGVALGKFYLATVGVLALSLAVLAFGRWVRRREWTGVVLLAAPMAAYAGYFATKLVFFERNLSHVLPLGLIVAGAGVAWLATELGRDHRWSRGVITAILLVLTAAPAAAVTAPLLTRALTGEDSRNSVKYAEDIRARYSGIEWRPISLIFPQNLATLRKDFSLGRRPVLVQFQEFNDSYSRHYAEVLDKEFVTCDAGLCPETLSFLPCSTLNVYHGPRTVFKIVTGKRWAAPTTP